MKILNKNEYSEFMRSQAPYFCLACREYMMFSFQDIVRGKVSKCQKCGEYTGNMIPVTAYMIENLLEHHDEGAAQ